MGSVPKDFSGDLTCIVLRLVDRRSPRERRRSERGSPRSPQSEVEKENLILQQHSGTYRAIYFNEDDGLKLEGNPWSSYIFNLQVNEIVTYRGINWKATDLILKGVQAANRGQRVSFYDLLEDSEGLDGTGNPVLA